MLEQFIEQVPSVNDPLAEYILMGILNDGIKKQNKEISQAMWQRPVSEQGLTFQYLNYKAWKE